MESISLPSNISVESDNDFKGELTIEPLYPGYGSTIANSLRRVLLSSLPGAAVYAFKIKGVRHEFSTIDYVKEDVVDISLNLKRVNLKSYSDEVIQLELKGKGAKVLTAGDITKNSDIEIANPEQPILTLTDKAATMEMTLWVRTGRGYEPVESREDELELNAIAIDAIYSPVVNVGYQTENVRVGGRTDYDLVKMQIETDGTITVAEAVKNSSQILAEHFQAISGLLGAGRPEEDEPRNAEGARDEGQDDKNSEKE